MKKIGYIITAALATLIIAFSVSAFADTVVKFDNVSANVALDKNTTRVISLSAPNTLKSGSIKIEVNKKLTNNQDNPFRIVSGSFSNSGVLSYFKVSEGGMVAKGAFANNALGKDKKIASRNFNPTVKLVISLNKAAYEKYKAYQTKDGETGDALGTIAGALKVTFTLTNLSTWTKSASMSLKPIDTCLGDGLHKISGVWRYVLDGYIKPNFSGFADRTDNKTRWRCDKGTVNFKYTSVVKDAGVWRYYVNGQFKKDFIGFGNRADNKTRWRINLGKVDFKYTDIVKDEGQWRYYEKGQWKKIDTIARRKANGIWYNIKSGVVSFTTGFATRQSDKTRWRIVKGQIYKKFTDIAKDEGQWRYYKNGKWTKTTTVAKKSGGASYYIKNGVAQTGFTGTVTINGVKYKVTKGVAKKA